MRITHRDALKKRKWYSSKYGWIDLDIVNNDYLQEIKFYWFKYKRPKIISHIEQSNCVSDRNKRRYEVIEMYDKMITKELVRRQIFNTR